MSEQQSEEMRHLLEAERIGNRGLEMHLDPGYFLASLMIPGLMLQLFRQNAQPRWSLG